MPVTMFTASVRSASRRLAAGWAQERAVGWTGATGLALGLAGLVIMAAHGPLIAPDGDLTKAISFDIAIGIYLLTLALFVPLAGFSPRGRASWRSWQVALAMTAYAIENVQIYRGLDPRFSRFATPLDELVGLSFGLTALGLIVMFVILAVPILRRPTTSAEGLLLLGIRYACGATMLAFAAGLWMGAVEGSRFGEAGDILPLHAAGFHGLQAVPLVALLLGWSRVPSDTARRWVHVAGIAWLGACAAIAWQTMVGRSVGEPSLATFVTAALLLLWIVVLARTASAWYRSGSKFSTA